ncbi:Sensor protein DivL [Pigmentiphaga humi]|uniref:histidine kinase n=1 Tax=Pigmentiphaga humi TaxID=2478468 RepID=A0A3P4B632_9BURK|nr:PAS domain-containing sensor histidine kinase [Pigmentiphaga humi]VCU71737.1 Sensor protein DivL [Pigmentiphaga humi]
MNAAISATELACAVPDRLLRDTPCVLWSATPDGDWDYVNSAWTRLTGQPVESALGTGWLACVPEARRAQLAEELGNALAAAEPFNLRTVVLAADGTACPMLMQGRPGVEPNLQLTGFSGTLLPLRNEDERQQEAFLSRLSHELRSPLNGIQSWAHVLESRVDGQTPGLVRALGGIRTGIQQQVQLLDELMDASHAMTGRMRLAMETVGLGAQARDAAARAATQAQARSVVLEVELPSSELWVSAAPERVRQMLDYLVDNAIRCSEPGAAVILSLAQDGREARMTVADSGQGISGDVLPYLFDPFRSPAGMRSPRVEGLGLRLAMVRLLAELHGGRVGVCQDEVGGVRFSVHLPLLPEAPGEAEAEAGTSRPAD